MKKGSLMRVLFCKIHCPFICFCKPSSAAHLYNSGPLKLENSTPHVVPSSTPSPVTDVVNGKQEGEAALPRSCIRKLDRETDATEVGRKKVQWMDDLGKELTEIKEFESSETVDTDNEEESSRCLCIIL